MKKEKIRLGIFTYGKGLGGNGQYVRLLAENLDRSSYEPVIYFYCTPCRERDEFLAQMKALNIEVREVDADGVPVPRKASAPPAGFPGKIYFSKMAACLAPLLAAPLAGFKRVLLKIIPADLKVFIFYTRQLWKSRQVFKDEKLDVLHFSLGGYPSSIVRSIAGAKLAGIPSVIVTVHILVNWQPSKAVRVFNWFLNKLLTALTIEFLALSETMKRDLLRNFGFRQSRISVIYNGVDLKKFSPAKPSDDFKKSLGVESSKTVVFFPARLDPIKGQEVLLQAILKNREAYASALFLLAGEGPSEKSLKDFCSQHGLDSQIRFLGFRRDIADLIRVSDLVLLPSFNEGFPFVLLEAMACSKPVIATDVGAVCEMVNESNGILIKAGDASALDSALRKLIEMPLSEREALGKSARHWVENQFPLEKMLQGVYQKYAQT